mgnify:CR=1 FL=1
MTPTIMVIINTITKPFKKRSEGGSPGSNGVSVMASPFQDDDLAADDRLVIVIGEDAPPRLDKALAAAVPEEAALSRSRLMKMICEGDVLSGGVAVTDPKTKVKEGDSFTLLLAPPVDVATLPEDIPLTVVWEDGDLIVIDKPAGMVVHPAPGTPSGTLVNALLAHCGDTLSGIGGERRPGIVHRIDKDTTGLLVVAKSDRAHHGLAAQFEAHTVNRHYLALVHGVPSAYDPRLRGLGGGNLPRCMADAYIQTGRLVVKKTERPQRNVPLHYAWRQTKTINQGRALQWWLSQLESETTRSALLDEHRSS